VGLVCGMWKRGTKKVKEEERFIRDLKSEVRNGKRCM
jgi:hypothetical protein